MKVFAARALVGNEWMTDVRVNLTDGKIADIQAGGAAGSDDYRVDALLPALSNLHSHSFQRAMAGMTEFRAQGRESFWTWRDLMYRFLDHLTPDHIEAIAALAFMEMLKSGYAAVGEFHYVHHQPGGMPYDNLGELSERIMAAADATGIGLTHLPVLYTYATVDGDALSGGQLRFGNDADRFQNLVETCVAMARDMPPDTCVGVAPHSLRAASAKDLCRVAHANAGCPIHIHVAEQTREVAQIRAALGARPVEWLLANAPVDAHWCLIHATHMSEAETRSLAQAGAVAGLCPVTEANLGDGIFNGAPYLAAGGTFGIGTDSNVNISMIDELRMLEYSQRLGDRQRNVMVGANGSVGMALYQRSAKGGAQALARHSGVIAKGKLADLVAIDTTDPRLCSLAENQLLDGLVFVAKDTVVTDVWSAGRHAVQRGRHVNEASIIARYRNAMKSLIALT